MSDIVAGELVRYEARIWRVGLVTESRARLDPVQGTVQQLLGGSFITYGASVNVSPGAVLEKVTQASLTEEQNKRAEKLASRAEATFIAMSDKEIKKMAAEAAQAQTKAVAQPTVSANKSANKDRVAALKAKSEDKKVGKAANPKPKSSSVQPCKCGCGEQVAANFAQGHDARFKSWMVKVERGEMKVEDLPKVVQKSYEFKKKGAGFVTTTNYKGEKHTGYDQPKKAKE